MWLITVLENDGNNVETRSHILLVSGDIGIGHGYQHPLFSFRHGQIGLTVFAAPACLYLYKEQKLAVLGNNVDFLMGYCANCVPKSRSPSLSGSWPRVPRRVSQNRCAMPSLFAYNNPIAVKIIRLCDFDLVEMPDLQFLFG